MPTEYGPAGRIAAYFIDSKLTPLMVCASLLLGGLAVIMLPREEEPQIVVPMIDVFVEAPGLSAAEVEHRVTTPMEKLLWEIPGVEYVYSTSGSGQSLVIVRFLVGEDEEDSILKTYNKLYSNFDKIPPGVSQPLVKPRSIDDVPILALTFWSAATAPSGEPLYDGFMLRRIVAELDGRIKEIPDVSETHIIGGMRRQLRVELDPSRLAGYGLDPVTLQSHIRAANRQLASGRLTRQNEDVLVEVGSFVETAAELEAVVVGSVDDRPVYLRDVARVIDGPAEPSSYVRFGSGPGASSEISSPSHRGSFAAVTLTVAKRQGTNAIDIANSVLEKVEAFEGVLIPGDVEVTVTRNYGETATEKSNELLFHMALATISVALLILFVLGVREAGVVAIAIPMTLGLSLFVFYILGYTLNRITLFALIFSIGILVDDAIVVVENIVRHCRLPANQGRDLRQIAVEAVDEVGNPTILATMAVIAAILPMAFVGGLMGPYMLPIPVGASAAMVFSLRVAFIVTPWASIRLLRNLAPGSDSHGAAEGAATAAYRRIMAPLIDSARRRAIFLTAMVGLLVMALLLVAVQFVVVKMLPFDNKSEFQVMVNTPEGTTLEATAAAAQEMATYLSTVPEVTDHQVYAGTSGPYNLNGLVRHYFLRRGPNVADIQVNLVGKGERDAQSHDVAKRVRPFLREIALRHGARIEVAEVPPGPPVLQTLVAEIYGPDYERQVEVAGLIKDIFERTEGVVDVDWYAEDPQVKYRCFVDKEQAALNGVSADAVVRNLEIALAGSVAGLAHVPAEAEDLEILLQMPQPLRSELSDLLSVRLATPSGMVPLSALVRV